MKNPVIRRVVSITQDPNPGHPNSWIVHLDCKHEVVLRATTKPTRRVMTCRQCELIRMKMMQDNRETQLSTPTPTKENT